MPSKIEWCDETLNPQGWGCWGPGGTPDEQKPCSYCYARRFAIRNTKGCEMCRQFIPHWHSEVFAKSRQWKKPRKIFWQSMGDLFHAATPQWQIENVLYEAKIAIRHTHIFLTKNPARYAEFNPWPENCWVGTTVTNQADADGRLPWLLQVEAPVRFVSHEPLMGATNLTCLPFGYIPNQWEAGTYEGHVNALTGHWCPITSFQGRQGRFGKIDWLILGGMTGPGAAQHQPYPAWVQSLIDQGRAAGVPIFLKDNLKWPVKIQEWPT